MDFCSFKIMSMTECSLLSLCTFIQLCKNRVALRIGDYCAPEQIHMFESESREDYSPPFVGSKLLWQILNTFA